MSGEVSVPNEQVVQVHPSNVVRYSVCVCVCGSKCACAGVVWVCLYQYICVCARAVHMFNQYRRFASDSGDSVAQGGPTLISPSYWQLSLNPI